jgi:hypothetical protein
MDEIMTTTITPISIELRPMVRDKDASYAPGEKIRGCREFWINGECWGYAVMHQHGCHGISFTFGDGAGNSVGSATGYKDRWVEISLKIERKRRYVESTDKRTTDEKLIDFFRGLIADGKVRAPGILREEVRKVNEVWARERKELDEKKARMREALQSVLARQDLTNYEHAGIIDAYKEIFHNEPA